MTSAIVVDVSVAVKWFFEENDFKPARAILSQRTPILAPQFLFLELANVFWKKTRAGAVDQEMASRMLEAAPSYFDELAPDRDLLQRALNLATERNHPVYDCLYLALADSRNLPLVTADARMIAKFADMPQLTKLIPLADWSPQ